MAWVFLLLPKEVQSLSEMENIKPTGPRDSFHSEGHPTTWIQSDLTWWAGRAEDSLLTSIHIPLTSHVCRTDAASLPLWDPVYWVLLGDGSTHCCQPLLVPCFPQWWGSSLPPPAPPPNPIPWAFLWTIVSFFTCQNWGHFCSSKWV